MADLLGVPTGTVMSRLSRARAELRDLMPLYESSELSDEMRAAVQQHVDTCEACRMAVND